MANQKRHNRNRRRKEFEGDLKSSLGMGTMLKQFSEYQQVKNFSENTVDTRRKHCNDFIKWCDGRSLMRVDEVNRPILQRYQKHLFYYRTKQDKPLSFRSQLHRLSSVRVWYAWMTRNNYLLSNPASELELPKVGKSLPKQILSPQDAELVLNQTDVSSPLGIRDRSIMETFYSTGIRRSELSNLDVYDLDTRLGVLRIRSGKGKQRSSGSDRQTSHRMGAQISIRHSAWLRHRSQRTSLVSRSRRPPFIGLSTWFDRQRLHYCSRNRQVRKLPSVPPFNGNRDVRKRRRHPLHSSDTWSRFA